MVHRPGAWGKSQDRTRLLAQPQLDVPQGSNRWALRPVLLQRPQAFQEQIVSGVVQLVAAAMKVSGICSAMISPLAVARPSAKTVTSTTTLRPLFLSPALEFRARGRAV